MIRNLKALLLAALAVTAFGALVASSAQAHTTATFTAPGAGVGVKTTLKVLPDGVGKTTHQVFDIRKADGTGILSITCNEAAGHGHMIGPEPEDATFETPQFQGNCNFAGQNVTVNNTGCNFTFTPGGKDPVSGAHLPTLHIVNDGANVCAYGAKPIHFTNTTLNCTVEVGAQTIHTGINYHNLPADGTVTLEAKEVAVSYKASGAGCPYGETTNGLFTTGNAIVTGERNGQMVNISYDPTKP